MNFEDRTLGALERVAGASPGGRRCPSYSHAGALLRLFGRVVEKKTALPKPV
jgi:hypothetical protein